MAIRAKLNFRTALAILGIAAAVVAGVVYLGVTNHWWRGQESDLLPDNEQTAMPELVCDANGQPVKPYTIRLTDTAVKGLLVVCSPVRPARNLELPTQVGQLGYDTDRLYAVRPRFPGEVIEIATRKEFHRLDESAEKIETTRFIGPGDWVKKGQVLAVIWSKELGDRKVALISALLDYYLDWELWEYQKKVAASLPRATLEATKTRVRQDIARVEQAEASLGIAKLTIPEIEAIHKEARAIQNRLQGKKETAAERLRRLVKDVPRWARVEILAPQSGKIVEKNTNLNDQVDSINSPPLFRIADMTSLLINVNFNEEYLPLLQPLMRRHDRTGGAAKLRWRIHIEADTAMPDLDLPILRVAPSLDPNNHTAMVIGRIPSPVQDMKGQDRHLIVGQFVTATVVIPPGPGLVEIPTNALNEVNGESLVLVKPNPKKNEYVLRRIAVVRRTRDWTQVRSKLTPRDREFSKDEVRIGRRPIEPLHADDVLVTRGVTEITEAFDALLAKARATKK